MSKENGFAPIRRGLWEHLRDGRMTPLEALAFVYICSQADTRTGIWKGSAGALVNELGFNPRTARDLLERMEHGDYIRRFVSQGMRRCYPILVHKFPITQGEHNGEVLDALSSAKQDGCLELRYFPREVDGEVHGEVRSSQRRIENIENKEKKNPRAAKTAAPTDPRFQPFFSFAFESYRVKHGRAPIWTGKDRNGLKNLLRGQSPDDLPLERLERLWEHFAASTEPFTAKQGDSLGYFCSNADKFSDGPILEKQGGSNGNLVSFAEQRSRANADALNRVLGGSEKVAGDIRRALPSAD